MTCAARQFGCSCAGGTCQSVTSSLPHRQARYERVKAKATRALHVASVCLAFCVVLAGVLLAAEGGIARQDIIMQEDVAWRK